MGKIEEYLTDHTVKCETKEDALEFIDFVDKNCEGADVLIWLEKIDSHVPFYGAWGRFNSGLVFVLLPGSKSELVSYETFKEKFMKDNKEQIEVYKNGELIYEGSGETVDYRISKDVRNQDHIYGEGSKIVETTERIEIEITKGDEQ